MSETDAPVSFVAYSYAEALMDDEGWRETKPLEVWICRVCGKPARYSPDDVVDLHLDGNYFCDDTKLTSATRADYLDGRETTGERKKRELAERTTWAD